MREEQVSNQCNLIETLTMDTDYEVSEMNYKRPPSVSQVLAKGGLRT